MPHVHVTEFVRAEPKKVLDLFRDLETFPEYMANVTSIEVVERGAGWSVSHWVTDLDGAPLEWREMDSFDDEQCAMEFRLTEGDIEQFEGRWCFTPCDGGTRATCDLDYRLGVPVIEEAVGPTILHKVEHNMSQMLAAIKQRLEQPDTAAKEA